MLMLVVINMSIFTNQLSFGYTVGRASDLHLRIAGSSPNVTCGLIDQLCAGQLYFFRFVIRQLTIKIIFVITDIPYNYHYINDFMSVEASSTKLGPT